MKAYVAVTAVLFLLVTVAHVLRAVQETHLAREPWFVLLTVGTTVLFVWAVMLLRTRTRSP